MAILTQAVNAFEAIPGYIKAAATKVAPIATSVAKGGRAIGSAVAPAYRDVMGGIGGWKSIARHAAMGSVLGGAGTIGYNYLNDRPLGRNLGRGMGYGALAGGGYRLGSGIYRSARGGVLRDLYGRASAGVRGASLNTDRLSAAYYRTLDRLRYAGQTGMDMAGDIPVF